MTGMWCAQQWLFRISDAPFIQDGWMHVATTICSKILHVPTILKNEFSYKSSKDVTEPVACEIVITTVDSV